jgi:SPX domain protein involved in polyphosphate accumulation
MYKMEINVSGQQRILLFRGPGCRKVMLEWWRDHLHRAEVGEDIRIRVLGTVGNKTDIVLEWPQARAARSGRAQSQ